MAPNGYHGEEAANGIEGARCRAVKMPCYMKNLKAHGNHAVVIELSVCADKYVSEGGFKVVGEALRHEEHVNLPTEDHKDLMDHINPKPFKP